MKDKQDPSEYLHRNAPDRVKKLMKESKKGIREKKRREFIKSLKESGDFK